MKQFLSGIRNSIRSFRPDVDRFANFILGLAALTMTFGAAYLVLPVLFSVGKHVMNPRELQPISRLALAKSSVMILRNDKRSGGSGVILSSSPTKSFILTNSHVCGVIENGGVVANDDGEYAVTEYKHASKHDLCLITVAADLKYSTSLADYAPNKYDSATIVGHPSLLPTTITTGDFTDRAIIEVLTDIRECKKSDIEADQDNFILCLFLGGIPVITRYEAINVTATISPGSSGSPVFNSDGEISGLVFAGTDAPNSAWVVTYEAIATFLNEEQGSGTLPNNKYELNAQLLKKQRRGYLQSSSFKTRLDKMCATAAAHDSDIARRVCQISSRDLLWRN